MTTARSLRESDAIGQVDVSYQMVKSRSYCPAQGGEMSKAEKEEVLHLAKPDYQDGCGRFHDAL
jgi:hypothetical protein